MNGSTKDLTSNECFNSAIISRAETMTAPREPHRPPSPPDRRPSPRGGHPSPSTASAAGRSAGFARLAGARRGLVGSVRALAAAALLALCGGLALPATAQAQEYTPLPGLRVSDGRVQFSFFQAGGCINLNSTINGVAYTTHTSKWQRKDGAIWVDVPGTERAGLCAYSTTSPGEYRLVAEISIGGQRGFYSSENTLIVEGMTPEEMMPPPVTGGPTYYFPHLAVGAGWQTTITYTNYSSQEVSCQTDFLSDQGTPLMVSFADRGTVVSRTDVLPPQGSVHQATNVGLNAPLAPGWARATCTGPVKASLLFRQHNSEGVPVAEAAVNAATVPATRFVTFAEQGEGKSGTGVAYANPSDTSAMLTFTAKDEAGLTLASVTQELPAGGHDAQNMTLLFGLTGFTGSLEVTSTEPIVTLSLNFEAAPVFSSLPPGEVDAAAQGSTTYYFPHLAVGASWQTTITYINYSSQEVSCTTEFLSDQGSPLMVSFADRGTVVSRPDTLPPGGSVHQETSVGLSAPLASGWARATCTGPVKASLLFRQHNSEGVPVAEAAVNAATVPATRFVTFAEQGEGKSGTGVAYANPSDTSAMLTFTAKDEAGQTLASVVRTLLPGGHDAQNMALLFGLSSFTGSLEITSTEPIVTLSLNFEAAPVFSSLPSGEVDAAPDVPGGGNNFGVGDALPGVPTAGQLFPVSGWATEWSGVTFSATTDRSTTYLTFDDGGYIQLQTGTRYTCRATGGCRVGNGVISRGTIVGSGGTPAPPPGNQPDLVIQTPSVSDSSPNAGGSFTLSATVRNQGNGLSASTTLRFYRSTDTTISSSDTEVGTDAVNALAAGGTSSSVLTLTAPSTAGTYYYGACVDPVSGESATGNNCSDSRAVTVRSGSNLQIYNDNVVVLPVTENLAAGLELPREDYTARFYEQFNDEFDFLVFVPNMARGEQEWDGAFYVSVKNDVQGIGQRIYSNNSSFGSAGKLQGVISFMGFFALPEFSDFRDSCLRCSDIRNGTLLHEFMHRWGNFVVPTNYGPHWGFISSGGYLDGVDISNMIDHGGGKFSAPNPFSSGQFSPIELYLAGFIPPEEVPDFQTAEDGKWLLDERGDIVEDDNGYRMFTASGFKTYTIEDIIAEHGSRVPDHSQAQKDFRAVVILLVSEDYPASQKRLEQLSDDVLWFSHAGKDEFRPTITNFYEATGGRGTITMDGLSQFQSRAGAKRLAAPSSFGTPPPPIVDLRE